MRPLFFDEPDNIELQTEVISYMWGKDFLITPILRSGVKEKEIYFPKKYVWFDLYTDERTKGGQTRTIETHKNYIPTHVRAGAFISMAKPMQTTKNYDANNLDLHYYHDISISESKGLLYNDDGLTANAFEKEEYENLYFNSQTNKKQLSFYFERSAGINYKPENKQIHFVIHNIQNNPKQVKINKEKVKFIWNESGKTLAIPVSWKAKENLNIAIKF
jgi:alpha-glucosidase (family GH31 glycosyl hydrolase)